MPNLFNARETLVELYRNRIPRLRGEKPGGNWIDIRAFGLPLNEDLSDACRLAEHARATQEIEHV